MACFSACIPLSRMPASFWTCTQPLRYARPRLAHRSSACIPLSRMPAAYFQTCTQPLGHNSEFAAKSSNRSQAVALLYASTCLLGSSATCVRVRAAQ